MYITIIGGAQRKVTPRRVISVDVDKATRNDWLVSVLIDTGPNSREGIPAYRHEDELTARAYCDSLKNEISESISNDS